MGQLRTGVAVASTFAAEFPDGMGKFLKGPTLPIHIGENALTTERGDGAGFIFGNRKFDGDRDRNSHLDSSSSGSAHGSETSMNVPMMSLTSAVIERRCFLATLTRASYRSRSMRTGRAALGTLAGSLDAPVADVTRTNVAVRAEVFPVLVPEGDDRATEWASTDGVSGIRFKTCHFRTPWFANAKVAPCYHAVNSIEMKRCPECGSVLVNRRCPRCDRWRVR